MGPSLERALGVPVLVYEIGAGRVFGPRPSLRAVLSRLGGFRYDGSEQARRRVLAALPLVAFSPMGA